MDRRLTVLYDAGCVPCRKARAWLARQDQLVSLEFLPAGSPMARQRFPELDAHQTLEVLHVVDERRNVYRGAKAWLICLWALDEYRGWSETLSRGGRLERAERFVRWVSARRYSLWKRNHAS